MGISDGQNSCEKNPSPRPALQNRGTRLNDKAELLAGDGILLSAGCPLPHPHPVCEGSVFDPVMPGEFSACHPTPTLPTKKGIASFRRDHVSSPHVQLQQFVTGVGLESFEYVIGSKPTTYSMPGSTGCRLAAYATISTAKHAIARIEISRRSIVASARHLLAPALNA